MSYCAPCGYGFDAAAVVTCALRSLPMSWLFAKVYERLIGQSEAACVRDWRAELLGGLTGDVLEIGAGTGLNLPHYQPAVTRLVLAEPDKHMRMQLQHRIDGGPRAPFPIELVGVPAEELPFPDGSFDAVVSTLVLCSVGDPGRAIAEIRRVLRPDGRFVYLEHVVAPEKPDRYKWQRRVEPVWKRLLGGCHLTRDTLAAIEAGGFDVEGHRRESMRKATSVARTTERGIAVKTSV